MHDLIIQLYATVIKAEAKTERIEKKVNNQKYNPDMVRIHS